ncbi:VOC family protein [Nocardioides sp. NPDC101246]|uniref:VOC family protein n=1 Tax=Nocardioides sp. NPDC101246 TaxID=3364336 RepID=UPI0037FE91AA
MSVGHIASINLECTDPPALAGFWAGMLGGDVVIDTASFAAVKVGELYVGATLTEGYAPPTWPSAERSQQIHLDITVDDLDAAERAAIDLGAVKEPDQFNPDRARVLRDPAGHPFCLRA